MIKLKTIYILTEIEVIFLLQECEYLKAKAFPHLRASYVADVKTGKVHRFSLSSNPKYELMTKKRTKANDTWWGQLYRSYQVIALY